MSGDDGDGERSHDVYKKWDNPAPRVKFSLKSMFMKMGLAEDLIRFAMACAPRDKHEEIRAKFEKEMLPAKPSEHRPEFSSPLARFDPSFDPETPTDSASGASPALREARCEVAASEVPSGGLIYCNAGKAAFAGGGGWKQRAPFLCTWDLSEEAPEFIDGSQDISSGFKETLVDVFMDGSELIWARGDTRIKAFDAKGECKYTLKAGGTNGGPLVVIGGKVLARASAKGSLQVWNVASLPLMRGYGSDESTGVKRDSSGEPKKKESDDRDGDDDGMSSENASDNDEYYEDAEDIDWTKGVESHEVIKLKGLVGSINHLVPLNGDYDKPKLIASTSHGSGAGIWIHKWPTYKPVALLLGHEDAVTGLSTAKGLPDWVLSSSYDGTTRLWDVRAAGGSCVVTLDQNDDKPVAACALAPDGSNAYAFAASTESIVCWDLRVQKPLYELATGNTDVCSMSWDATTQSLVAACECDYEDRLGFHHDYGEIQGYQWPKCDHKPKDFPRAWDARTNVVIRYKFSDQPDLEALPDEPEPGEEYDYDSDDNEADEWKPIKERDFW